MLTINDDIKITVKVCTLMSNSVGYVDMTLNFF